MSVNKRIQRDLKELMEANIPNVHFYFNPNNQLNVKFLIRGENDTPYHNGSYIFDMIIPENYPVNPPSVKFISNDGTTRCHPNFYACGKVCLSIIGTFSGPSWSPIMTLQTIVVSIQSLLNVANPITCEPSFENMSIDHPDAQKYIKTALEFNKRHAIEQMKKEPPVPEFKELINSFKYD